MQRDYADSYLESLKDGSIELEPSKVMLYGDFSPRSESANFNFSSSDIPKGSVAVMPLQGPIMRDDNCGDAGSMTKASQMRQAADNENISSIMIDVASGGGQSAGTPGYAAAVKYAASKKKVTALVNQGVAASAAYWGIVNATEIAFSSSTDEAGSIGAYVTIDDNSKRLEDFGIKEIIIYAPQSTEKNKEYNEALKGNDEPMKEKLAFLVDEFLADVQTARGSRLNLEKINKGAMFYAADAIKYGLGDRMASFDEVLTEHTTAAANSIKNNITSKMEGLEKLSATLGVEALESNEKGVYLSDEQLETIETALNAEPEGMAAVEAALIASTDKQVALEDAQVLAEAKTTALVTAVNEGLKAAGEENAEATAETLAENIGTMTTRLTEWGALPGAVESVAHDDGKQTGSSPEKYEHNEVAFKIAKNL